MAKKYNHAICYVFEMKTDLEEDEVYLEKNFRELIRALRAATKETSKNKDIEFFDVLDTIDVNEIKEDDIK